MNVEIARLSSDREARVWKALADPTRRRILDELRVRKLTTGGLTALFDLSRFGVMKHVKLLRAAGLVITEVRGRERWHSVNPVPIRAIHQRWVRQFETSRIDRALRLQAVAEGDPNAKKRATMTDSTAEFAEVLIEVLIEASPERTWQALVNETSAWWHRDFYTVSGDHRFVIEQKLGGLMYEDWGAGEGQVWGLVNGLRSPAFLQIVGDSSKEWGGPNRGIMTWRLGAEQGRTRLRFDHSLHGRVTEATRASLESGWQLLFAGCLKPYAETGVAPDPDSIPAPDCG